MRFFCENLRGKGSTGPSCSPRFYAYMLFKSNSGDFQELGGSHVSRKAQGPPVIKSGDRQGKFRNDEPDMALFLLGVSDNPDLCEWPLEPPSEKSLDGNQLINGIRRMIVCRAEVCREGHQPFRREGNQQALEAFLRKS